jgi:hypothetical protein
VKVDMGIRFAITTATTTVLLQLLLQISTDQYRKTDFSIEEDEGFGLFVVCRGNVRQCEAM